MGFTKYSLCETDCQGSSEISFIHLNIDNLFYAFRLDAFHLDAFHLDAFV